MSERKKVFEQFGVSEERSDELGKICTQIKRSTGTYEEEIEQIMALDLTRDELAMAMFTAGRLYQQAAEVSGLLSALRPGREVN